jgi:hypothetical protein
MKKMRNTFFGIFLAAGFFLLSAGMARSAGIPAAFLINNAGELSLILFNFDQTYSTQEVNDLLGISAIVLGLAGDYLGEGSVVALGPSDLPDADSTHALVLSNLNLVEMYLLVNATKVDGPAGTNLRFDLWLWGLGMNDQYVGALEVLEELVNSISSLF